jgi:hypothetical protein
VILLRGIGYINNIIFILKKKRLNFLESLERKNKMTKSKSIQINVIFTYDNKDQDTIDLYMSEDEFAFNLRNEVALVKWVINKSFFRDIEEANDLLKI